MSNTVLSLIVLLPLAGAALIGLTGFLNERFRHQEKLIGLIATSAVAIPFFIILAAFLQFTSGHGEHHDAIRFSIIPWIETAGIKINFSYHLDQLSLLMGMIVTGIGSLIHIYSIAYMHHDKGFYKFFLYLNLFIFAMLNLILGDNMAVLFLGWEGVGVCSYLLIGFWYEDMEKAKAAQKAFVANRIGDFAMIGAMFMIFGQVHSLNFADINASAGSLGDNAFWITLLLFIAATGKSAQIPLYVWLPDAMAGPTPVSALIHAATMVTSGIYLIARMHPVFNVPAAEPVLIVIAVVAAATAILAALIAIAQNDIKKVLAYSTVSQLGFMFMALGAGAYTTAIFHVMTHAFFKACLFLGSGSVIHAMHHYFDETHDHKDPQDIRFMGGLKKYMPATGMTFWISTLAIAGIPGLSGFFSKDEILANTFFSGFDHGSIYFIVWLVGTITACLTAFYMTRLTYLTFFGEARYKTDKHHPHESSPLMTIPLWILGILAVVGGYLGLPAGVFGHNAHILNHTWFHGLINNRDLEHTMHEHIALEYGLLVLAIAIAVGVVYFAYNFYAKNGLEGDEKVKKVFGGMYKWMENKFYVDEFYEKTILKPFVWAGDNIVVWFDKNIIDGVINGSASATAAVGDVIRRMQTGYVAHYALIISIGVVIIIGYLILG